MGLNAEGRRSADIVFSFDRTGYLRHQADFDPLDLQVSMRDKVCLVTGASGGLGLALATGLAERAASVHLLCRNAGRAATAQQTIIKRTGNPKIQVQLVDVADLESIRTFASSFVAPRIDVLVHNAGVLPKKRELTRDGLEVTVATHLVGPWTQEDTSERERLWGFCETHATRGLPATTVIP